jgi:hypothetical protein
MDVRSAFVTVPTEVRFQIYTHVFMNFAFSFAENRNRNPTPTPNPTWPPSSSRQQLPDTSDTPRLRFVSPHNDHTIGALSLLQTSHQVRSEGLSILKQRLASHPLVLYYKYGPFSNSISTSTSSHPQLPLIPPLSTTIRLFILPYGGAGGWSIIHTLTALETIGSCITVSEYDCRNLANDDYSAFRRAITKFLTVPRFRRRRWQIFSYLMSASRSAKGNVAIWLQLRFVTRLKAGHPIGHDSNVSVSRIRQAVWMNVKGPHKTPETPWLMWCRPTRGLEDGDGRENGSLNPFYNPPLEEPGVHPRLDQIIAAWPKSGSCNDGVKGVKEWHVGDV